MGLSLFAILGLDRSGYSQGLKGAKQDAQQWEKAMQGVTKQVSGHLGSIFGIGAAVNFTKELIEWGSNIYDSALKLNISTEAMQELEYAAKQTGASIENIAKGFKGLSMARETALGGGEAGAEKLAAFAKFGVSEDQLRNNPIEETFKQIAAFVQNNDLGQDELAVVTHLLGKSGMELLPAFRDGLADLMEEAKNLGLVLPSETIEQLDTAGDKISQLALGMKVALAPAVLAVAGALSNVWDYVRAIGGGLGAFIGAFIGTEGSIGEKFAAGKAAKNKAFDEVVDEQLKKEQELAVWRDKKRKNVGVGGESDPEVAGTKKAVQLRSKLLELERKALSPAEKRAAIEAEISGLKQSSPANETADLERQIRQRELEGQLSEMDKGQGKDPSKGNFANSKSDALLSVGNFLGAGASALHGAQIVSQEVGKVKTELVAIKEYIFTHANTPQIAPGIGGV